MMKLKTPFKVKCLNCEEINVLDMALVCISSYIRKLGLELEYTAVFDGVCPKCRKDIYVRVGAWEYPKGTLEDFIVETKGAEKIEEPEFLADSETF